MKSIICIFLLLGLALADPLPKQLAGPPSEFEDHDIPSPVEAALNQRAAFIREKFLEDGSKDFELPVDSPTVFAFNFFSPEAQSFTMQLFDPDGNVVPLEGHEHPGSWPIGDSSNFEVPVLTFVFENPKVGVWKLTLTAHGLSNQTRSSQYPNVAVMLFNDSPLQAFTYLSDYQNEKGREIGLIARITDQTQWAVGSAPVAIIGSISAEMEVITPDGNEIDVPMHDDGLHGDGAALDGVYGATIKATQAGQYMASAVLEGTTADGLTFLRTTEHLITVVDDSLEFTGLGAGVGESNRIDLYLFVNKASSSKYRAYSEVWGVDANGNEVPICWISSMVNVQKYGKQPAVRLELDLNWAAIANAKAPYVLKNAYIQEVGSFIPISQVSIIKITMASPVDTLVSAILQKGVPTITNEMLEGVRPPESYFYRNTTAPACNFIVTHGYCAGVNPWQQFTPNDFTNACFFLVKNANLLHDAYAMKIADYAADIPSWGGLGHSQGGLVMLHLENHYWTGLSNSKGNRRIQSVGSPYTGCTGAGNAANLIKIFGIACGANSDLTVDGSKLWLAGITSTAKKQVYYATSTYVQGKLFGDYCNMAVNLVLQWPNDGTSELSYAQLSGGNNLGNKEKWCHTTEMGYPAQYTDSTRNKDMNANAAR